MKTATCETCGETHSKQDGVVTVAHGSELRFCSETCRAEWQDSI